jgi:2-methylaconitate cis-trans-isomerase PrpF
MKNGKEIKTMAIPVMLQQAKETGLITEESVDALNAEKLLAQERIENLKRQCRENEISREQMEAGIREIQQQVKEKVAALGLDDD